MIHYISHILGSFFPAKSYGTFKSCWCRQMHLANWRTWLVHQVAGAKDCQRGIGLNEHTIVHPVWSRLEWNEWMGSVHLALLQSDYVNSRSLVCCRDEYNERGLALARAAGAEKVQMTLTQTRAGHSLACVCKCVRVQAPALPELAELCALVCVAAFTFFINRFSLQRCYRPTAALR